MNKIRVSAILAGLSLLLEPAHADVASKISRAGGGATLEQSVSPPSGVQILASKSTSSVAIKLSRIVSELQATKKSNKGLFSILSAVASAPLNKAGGDSDLATLDGFANAASLEVSLSKFSFSGIKHLAFRSEEVDLICERVRRAAAAAGDKLDESGCDSGQVAKYGSSMDRHAFESAFWDVTEQNRWVWGFSAKVGTQDFAYVDPTDATKQKISRAPWGAGAFLALNRESWRSVFTLRLQYQDAYKDADSGAVCPPSAGASIVCATGPVGRPGSTKKELISVEARHAFPRFGAGLTAVYDNKADVFGIELPIHLVKDKDGNLTAGVKAGWRDDTDDVTFSVFVGSTFGLFD